MDSAKYKSNNIGNTAKMKIGEQTGQNVVIKRTKLF